MRSALRAQYEGLIHQITIRSKHTVFTRACWPVAQSLNAQNVRTRPKAERDVKLFVSVRMHRGARSLR